VQKITSLFIAFIFFSCTENPFGGDKKITDKTISGYVKLDQVEYYPKGFHGGVFVWSKDLGLQTKTDIDGSFEFVLPASNEPSSGAIIDGDYDIHFFLGNYKISKVTITFAGGQVLNDEKVINLEGELRRDVSMTRELGVHTTVTPEIIPSNFDNPINVMVTITPDRTDLYCEMKKIENRSGVTFTGLLIKNIVTDELTYTVDNDSASIMREYIDRPMQKIEIDFDYIGLNLPKGTYEIIPYMVLERNDIPTHLLQALGPDIYNFSEAYFNYPFYRTGGKFVIE
jgi:hypothetical protein